jgi:membrane protein implicated in regulation of membrane protease activity
LIFEVLYAMVLMMIVMCLPILALPVFWFLPLDEAIPIYIICLLLSGSMFWIMRDNMKRPVSTGSESLIGKDAKVVSQSASDKIAPYLVHIEGELWSASSHDPLQTGDTVVIIAVKGNKLRLERKDKDQGG